MQISPNQGVNPSVSFYSQSLPILICINTLDAKVIDHEKLIRYTIRIRHYVPLVRGWTR